MNAAQRDEIAKIIETVGRDGLPSPRDLDVALDAVESALASARVSCVWTYDADTESWDTQCGEKWHFEAEGPKENNARFCFCCGGALAEHRPVQSRYGDDE